MSMARLYHDLHIFSRMPGDIVVSAREDADITFVTIEAAADDYSGSRVVISLRSSNYPAFAQMVCEALAAAMTGEDMKEDAFS